MGVIAGIREKDRSLTKRLAGSASPGLHRALSAVEEAAQATKLWCGAAAATAWKGGGCGRKAAAAGLAAVAVAQLVPNGACKQLAGRPRPPRSGFRTTRSRTDPIPLPFLPFGHTAAALAFTTVVAPTWPLAGVLCAVPAAMVAVERVQSGAHYPSDVAGGAAIGLASAWLIRHVPHLVLRRWL
ncbi:phosphatase PAP2 family protein [Streptomyces aureus]